jgi:hypothetical protein
MKAGHEGRARLLGESAGHDSRARLLGGTQGTGQASGQASGRVRGPWAGLKGKAPSGATDAMSGPVHLWRDSWIERGRQVEGEC